MTYDIKYAHANIELNVGSSTSLIASYMMCECVCALQLGNT